MRNSHAAANLSVVPRNAEELEQYVGTVLDEQIEWYRRRKKLNQRFAITLRWIAVSMLITGGACPLATAAFGLDVRNLGFVLLALSAGAVAFDRILGFSSSWSRLLATALDLEGRKREFVVQWAVLRAETVVFSEAAKLASEQIKLVNDLISKETAVWATEFRSTLAEMGPHQERR